MVHAVHDRDDYEEDGLLDGIQLVKDGRSQAVRMEPEACVCLASACYC